MAGEAFGLDPSTIDLNAWIDGVQRPEVTVSLYPYDLDFQRRVVTLEAKIAAAEKVSAENRGIAEASAEALMLEVQQLRAEREATALRVRVQQLTDVEMGETAQAARDAGVTETGVVNLWVIAKACIEPAFTPDQLARLRTRDRSGEHMVAQLYAAVIELARGLPVPFSSAPFADPPTS